MGVFISRFPIILSVKHLSLLATIGTAAATSVHRGLQCVSVPAVFMVQNTVPEKDGAIAAKSQELTERRRP